MRTHLHGFKTTLILPDGSPHSAPYLHTSPEFARKLLVTAGERKIFSLTSVFRNRERTALHAPEFAMLEWYRAHAPLELVIEDCAAVIALTAHIAGAKVFAYRGREVKSIRPPRANNGPRCVSALCPHRPLRQPIDDRPSRYGSVRPTSGGSRYSGSHLMMTGRTSSADPHRACRTQSRYRATNCPIRLSSKRGGARSGKLR